MKPTPFALVTGATSGIGYELARQAARRGFNLVLVARDEEELLKVKSDLSPSAVQIIVIPKDLFDEHAADEIYAMTRGMELDIALLINNAGQGQFGEFIDTGLERHMDIIRLNIMSLVSLTHLYLKDMIRRGGGRILQVGSEVSKIPGPMFAVYAATKSFVASFTEAVINELEDTDVTMTLLMPGGTDTDFFDKADMEHTKVYREGKLDSPEEVAERAFEGLMAGDRRVIGPAGQKNVAMATVTPDHLLAKQMRSKMEPSDKDPPEARQEPMHERSKEVRDKNTKEHT